MPYTEGRGEGAAAPGAHVHPLWLFQVSTHHLHPSSEDEDMEGVFPNELSLQQVRVAALHSVRQPFPRSAALKPPGRCQAPWETAQGRVLVRTHQAPAGEGPDVQRPRPMMSGGAPKATSIRPRGTWWMTFKVNEALQTRPCVHVLLRAQGWEDPARQQ